MRLAFLHTRIRTEERLLLDALHERDIDVEPIDLRRVVFDLTSPNEWSHFDLALDRSMSLTASLSATRILEAFGVRCINRSTTVERCGDKLQTTLALLDARVPVPGTRIALDDASALDAVEANGYPAVIKPTVGSWGRLVSRLNDREAAEAVIEHRSTLGSIHHQTHYVQEHIAKPDRDLRVFVIGGQAVAAIERRSEHWITNSARGGQVGGIELTDELRDLSQRSADAVGADLGAIDLLECPQRGLLVNEINHSMEFRNSIETTGVDLPARIAEWLISASFSHHTTHERATSA